MSFEIKTDFDSLEDAIAYLKGDASDEISRLEKVEGELGGEKTKLLKKRDELLKEAKETKAKYEKFKGHEDVDIDELITFKETHSGDESEIEKRYQQAYSKDKKAFEARLAVIEEERKADKAQAEEDAKKRVAAEVKATVISEFSKGQHKILNTEQFWLLFGNGKIQTDEENGSLFVDVDYKKLSIPEYVKTIAEDPDNQHHFAASGRTGSGGNKGIQPVGKQKKWGEMTTTEKSLLYRTDQAKARQLASEAGNPIPE